MSTAQAAPTLAFDTIDALLAFLAETAQRSCEEPGLSELDHGLQCAAELAVVAPDDHALQIAGLVHDVAHSECHIAVHATVGAEAVRGVLGNRIADIVELHVDAKRYLIATDADYAAKLSAVSTETLALQGGAMDADEVGRFAAHPHAAAAVMLRRADEAAKQPGRTVPPLDHWVPMLRKVATAQAA